jgi:Ricin-type beta-trefoil lectin domain-like
MIDNGNFFLLFNLAVGGNWPNPGPDGNTPWPATMTVDYVRIRKWQGGAGSIKSSAWYQIINQNSGSCMDDTGWGTSNGTTVQQWQYVRTSTTKNGNRCRPTAVTTRSSTATPAWRSTTPIGRPLLATACNSGRTAEAQTSSGYQSRSAQASSL